MNPPPMLPLPPMPPPISPKPLVWANDGELSAIVATAHAAQINFLRIDIFLIFAGAWSIHALAQYA
jgi:hypothetical protein